MPEIAGVIFKHLSQPLQQQSQQLHDKTDPLQASNQLLATKPCVVVH